MNIRKRISFIFVVVFLLSVTTAFSAGHEKKDAVKNGILLVTFGTSVPEAEKSFEHIGKKVKEAFPNVDVRWSYTSFIIRKKLAKEGKMIDSPEIALAKMMDEGFTHVAVQSLHMMPGFEYEDLFKNARLFSEMAGGIQKIACGSPLLMHHEDFEKTVEAALSILPSERGKDDAIVFMGHGTHHPSNAVYAALMYEFWKKDKNIFVGTVEGSPDIEDIKVLLLEKNIKKAYLIPLMSVAGDHARNDMAGDEPDSWKSILSSAGITCVPVLKGLAEYDAFAGIWVDHLKKAMKNLE